jgi:hypothetical protein
MTIDADKLFKAESKSVATLLNGAGECFYIPAYQRQYTWQTEDVQRLVESVASGLVDLFHDESAYTFLGTTITIVDTNHDTVQPHFHGELPAKVHLVIDGQQRLTTITLLLLAIHREMRTAFEKLRKVPDNEITPFQSLLVNQLGGQLGVIKKSLVEEQFAGFGKPPAPYIRIIRAYDDAWSKVEVQRKYESPIASMINEYGITCNGFDIDVKPKKFAPKQFTDREKQTCKKRFGDIEKFVKSLLEDGMGDNQEIVLPTVAAIFASKTMSESLGISRDDVIRESSKSATQDELNAMRIVAFAIFVLNRVALTVVQVEKDEYAFAVFDALNTTGQPLAPFETFIPLVMKAVKLANYQNSKEFALIEKAKGLIGDLDVAGNQKIALEAAISFALAECGAKIGLKHQVQRNLYRSTFKRVENDLDERLDYLEHLVTAIDLHANAFNSQNWASPVLPQSRFHSLDEETKVCLSFLNKLKHTIVIPILTRFWINYERSINTPVEQLMLEEFEKAVKACTAFTVLRRATTGDVRGIDSIYRDIVSGDNKLTSLGALQRSGFDAHGAIVDLGDVTSANLLNELNRRLTDTDQSMGGSGISNKTLFINAASNVDIYRKSQTITRFMLLVAQHNTVADAVNPGMIQMGAMGVNNRFTLQHWVEETSNSVEHVVPQTRPKPPLDDWDPSVYENPITVHRIGNLALCPLPVNIAASNRPWSEKQVIYKAAGSTTEQVARQMLKGVVDVEDDFYGVVEHVPYLVSIGNMANTVWDEKFISARSTNLLGLVWDRLAPWLGIPII